MDSSDSESRSNSSAEEADDPFVDDEKDVKNIDKRTPEDEGLFRSNEERLSNGIWQALYQQCGEMNVLALIGLVVAGLAGTLIADIFGMFYVDCFLRAYQLPMTVFGIGSAIFAVINTANDVAGAYFVDWYASKNGQRRDQLVGLSAVLYALTFLTPFFRWDASNRSNAFWDGLHFVGSLSLYDTMFSFNCILQGSIVSDNHSMTQGQRITFFVCKDLVGILAPLVVTKIGLSLFDVTNLRPFRVYVVILATISSLLAILGQKFINSDGTSNKKGYKKNTVYSSGYTQVKNALESETDDRVNSNDDEDVDLEISSGNNSNSTLRFWQVVRDFVAHPNFRYWIAMEMLMEMQNTFLGNFQKTFVDQLLYNNDDGVGWSREICDWTLALLDPATQIVGLLLFLPIRKYGYARCYTVVFGINIGLATTLLVSKGLDYNPKSLWPVATFLISTSVLSNAMAGAGFGLAMCDMVLEMKHSHLVVQKRTNPPSLAGLFMGVNALFCKPAESVLPILTASFLGDAYNTNYNNNTTIGDEGDSSLDDASKTILYRLLVIPPLVCAILQLLVWSRYSLVPEHTEQLRKELGDFEQRSPEKRVDEKTSDNGSNGIEMSGMANTNNGGGGYRDALDSSNSQGRRDIV